MIHLFQTQNRNQNNSFRPFSPKLDRAPEASRLIWGDLPCKPRGLLREKVPGRNLQNDRQQPRRGAECKGGWESHFSVKIEGKNRCDEPVLDSQHKRGGEGGKGRRKAGGRWGKEGEPRGLQKSFPFLFLWNLLLGQLDKPRTGTENAGSSPSGPGSALPGPDPAPSLHSAHG